MNPKTSSLAPQPELNSPWRWFQTGLLIFPTLPAFGGLIFAYLIISLWVRYYRRLWKRPCNLIAGSILLVLLLSSAFAYKPGEAFLGTANFLPGLVGFAPFAFLLQTPAQLRRIAWISVLGAIPVLILGLGQGIAAWLTPTAFNAILGWVLEPGGNPPGRIASTFMYANIFAGYLLVIWALAWGLAIEAYQTYQQKRQSSQALAQFLVLLIFLGTVGMALLLTSSRNAWGTALIVVLGYGVYLGWRWLVLGVITAAGAILWAAFGTVGQAQLRAIVPDLIWLRLSGAMYPNVPEAHLRTTQWQFAWEMIQERPFLGWGLRNFSHLYELHWQLWLGHPHNLFLMLGAETGAIATMMLCSFVGWAIAQALILVYIWSRALRVQWYRDRLILLAFIVAFGSCILFNCLDVSIFDLRLGYFGWILLFALWGVTARYRKLLPLQGWSRISTQVK
ncbi:MAG: O-antigen ligase family protein [Jaaginema sp. PMC 1079.18]|nr:O-antigen ligase family protein [Jaaginema sp. PMC 1080.18]MEC4852289.1 O-antigen ligase family protein [Jaaginema sp. PMC 1079.18]MEC4868503.1 O-antigen ligase family protein [Jaaginema sp. PMC 1078.18]